MANGAPKPQEDLSTDASQKKIKNAAKKLQQDKDDLLYKIATLEKEISKADAPKGTTTSSIDNYQSNLTASEKYAIEILKRDKEYEIAKLQEKIQALDESLSDPNKAFEYEQAVKEPAV